MPRLPLQLGQLGALCWLASSSLAACEEDTRRGSNSQAAPPAPGDRLRLVQVVFRHGARTPLTDKFWPEANARWEKGTLCGELLPSKLDIAVTNGADGGPQPFSRHDARQAAKVLPGGCTKGELTLVGQRQALDLGAWLRARYLDSLGFLPQRAAAGVVSGTLFSRQLDALSRRTTNYRRTIGTLEYVVSGLYQSADAAIPVTTATELDEILFANTKNCERLGALMSAQRHVLKEEAQRSKEVQQLEALVHDAMGTSPQSGHVAFVELHDALTTLRFHGKELPGRFDEQLLAAVEAEAARRMLAVIAPDDSAASAKGLLRLGVGRLTAQIVQQMDAAAAGDTQHRLYLYSGHDTTIMPLLRALGVPVDHWPGYLSNLVFELWERPAEGGKSPPTFLVRVLYQQEVLQFPGTAEDGTIELKALHSGAFGGHALDEAKHADLCAVNLQHEGSEPKAAESGDAVQGL